MLAIWLCFQIYEVKTASPFNTCCYKYSDYGNQVLAEGTWVGANLASPINQVRVQWSDKSDSVSVTSTELLGGTLYIFQDDFPVKQIDSNKIVAEANWSGLLTNTSGSTRIEIDRKSRLVTQIKNSTESDSMLILRLEDAGFKAADIQEVKAYIWPLSLFTDKLVRQKEDMWDEIARDRAKTSEPIQREAEERIKQLNH